MSVLSAEGQSQVEVQLVEQNLLTQDKLDDLKFQASNSGKSLLQLIAEQNAVPKESMTKLIADATGNAYIDLSDVLITPEIIELLPRDDAMRYMAVPFAEENGRVSIAMLDASNVQAVDYLANKIGHPLNIFVASEFGLQQALTQYSADLESGVSDAIASDSAEKAQAQIDSDVKTIVQDSPISKALSAILDYAVQKRASDIHIEPRENDLRIRARVDGILNEIMVLPKSIEPALVSRIKILSNLKIDEHRVPQDGQFKVHASNKDVDLRIAISPVVWGEQVVIRILDKSEGLIDLAGLGFVGPALRAIREGINRPNGMILSSGPTGSGKSTTLYALIQEIISDEINIVTLEDPVEYKMDGVNQIQVNNDVGLTFAGGLRSILRQDPNVVMVGEIRDPETANLAVQAALTGHLVFSTLHTNSAAGVLPRLLDMGIEPFLIASTVNTVIGQRLVRRLAGDPQPYMADPSEIEGINASLGDVLPQQAGNISEVSNYLGFQQLPLAHQNAYTLYKGQATEQFPNGYKGRMGIYEVFSVKDEIESLVINHATSSQIQRAAQEQGMLTMRQDGYLKALSGVTSADEVNRVTVADNKGGA
jgi:type IV pilus assembly protein PilB